MIKKIFRTLYLFHLLLAIFILILCALFAASNPDIGTLMIYRKINNHYKVKPICYVPLKKIPEPIITMVIAAEDDRFYEHWGIDLEGIHEALYLKNNLKMKYYGGSTITQQLVRTLFLFPDKTFTRKYFEIFIAVEMDALLKKDRILELYLNSIEWGKGIFGIENASYYYFNKSVDQLDTDEMIRLVTIMPSPVKYNTDNFNTYWVLSKRYEFLKEVMGVSDSVLSDTNNIDTGPGTNSDTNNEDTNIPDNI
jgi:monofunctional biosynthetic peptidoglycan transglycosylase